MTGDTASFFGEGGVSMTLLICELRGIIILSAYFYLNETGDKQFSKKDYYQVNVDTKIFEIGITRCWCGLLDVLRFHVWDSF
jgi:hypothetical protein